MAKPKYSLYTMYVRSKYKQVLRAIGVDDQTRDGPQREVESRACIIAELKLTII